MAKKKRRKKSSKKSLHVKGVIVRIQGKKRAKRFVGPKPPRGFKRAAPSVVKDVKKVIKKVEAALKFPFKSGKGHVFGLKMKIRGRKKFGHTDHRSSFSD
jgi:hypothetical protein